MGIKFFLRISQFTSKQEEEEKEEEEKKEEVEKEWNKEEKEVFIHDIYELMDHHGLKLVLNQRK